MNSPKPSLSAMEQRLSAFYAAEPSAAFVDRLGKDLHSRAARLPSAAAAAVPAARRLRPALAAILLLALAVLFFAATPQGRALAWQIVQYFQTTAEKYFPPSFAPTRTPVPTFAVPAGLMPLPKVTAVDKSLCGETISPLTSTFPCQLVNAESEAGFEIRTFPADRLTAGFRYLYVNRTERKVFLAFDANGASYQIEQGLGDFPPGSRSRVAEDAVETVTVNQNYAEYAAGNWVTQPDSGTWWYPGEPVYRLAWKENARWFQISVFFAAPDGMKETLIGLAENLATLSQGTDKLTGAGTPTVEQQAGFEVLEPALVPEDFHLCDAGFLKADPVLSITDLVTLTYCLDRDLQPVAFLSLFEMPASVPAELEWKFSQMVQYHKDPTTAEEVRIGGLSGRYLENEMGRALIWTDGKRKMMIAFTWKYTYGGRLAKAGLAAIAETLV